MADNIKELAHECLHDPKHISLVKNRAAPVSIEHCFYYLHPKDKESKLLQFIKEENINQAIIFCNARHLVDKLHRTLRDTIKYVDFIHGGIPQERRTSIIRKFRKKDIQYLIATDVAGRGLDFSHVSHIINWDFPGGSEQYTHRTGRAGRMGRKGKAVTFVTNRDKSGFTKLIRAKKITPVWIGNDPTSGSSHTSNDQQSKPAKKKRPFNRNRNRNRKD